MCKQKVYITSVSHVTVFQFLVISVFFDSFCPSKHYPEKSCLSQNLVCLVQLKFLAVVLIRIVHHGDIFRFIRIHFERRVAHRGWYWQSRREASVWIFLCSIAGRDIDLERWHGHAYSSGRPALDTLSVSAELWIFRVIFTFCSTLVAQNVERTGEIPSSTSATIVMMTSTDFSAGHSGSSLGELLHVHSTICLGLSVQNIE